MSDVVNLDESSSSECVQSKLIEFTLTSNPLRRPTWRWDRITHLASKEGKRRKFTKADDSIVVKGCKYMVQYSNDIRTTVQTANPVDLDNALHAAFNVYPEMALAHKIYTDRSFARYAIEALVLARQSPADIAKELGCPASVVETYEFVFFDVRDRLDNEMYIMDALLSPALKYGMGGTDYDFMWKSVAYSHGVLALRAMWTLKPVDEDTKTKLADLMKTVTDRNVLKATVIRQPNQHNAHDIVQESIDRAAVDASAKQPAVSSEKAFMEGAKLLSTAIQLSVASGIVKNASPKEIRANYTIDALVKEYTDVTPVEPDGVYQEVDPPVPEKSVFDRPSGPPQNSNGVGKSVPVVDLQEKKDLILKRIRSKVMS